MTPSKQNHIDFPQEQILFFKNVCLNKSGSKTVVQELVVENMFK